MKKMRVKSVKIANRTLRRKKVELYNKTNHIYICNYKM